MAIYSTEQNNSSYGNVAMAICVYRGDCTRTATKVSFNFGVRFRPTAQWTTNSIAAHYNNKKLFANLTLDKDHKSTASVGVNYHAYYTSNSTPVNYTSEYLGFSYENSNIDANTTSVDVTVGVGWNDWAGTQKGTLTFSIPIDIYRSKPGTPSVSITDNGNNTFTVSATKGSDGSNNPATGVSGVGYSYDNSNWYSGSSGNITGDGTVYGRAFTVGTYDNSDYATVSAYVKYYSKPGKPTVTITDNGDNTFTISAIKGSDGYNNVATGVDGICYSFDNSNWTYESSGSVSSDTTVYASARTKGTYTGNNNNYLYSDWAYTDKIIKYYAKPSNQPKPSITYDTKKPTLKSTYTISWEAAQAGNSNSPIVGYRIRLFKYNESTGTYNINLGLGTNYSGDYYIETTANNRSISFTKNDLAIELNAKDKIKVALQVWSLNGKNERLWYNSDINYATMSDACEIKNLGVIKIKQSNGTWIEGQVWIKKSNNIWYEASGVFIKDNNTWKEST